jgi:hypothetical protein
LKILLYLKSFCFFENLTLSKKVFAFLKKSYFSKKYLLFKKLFEKKTAKKN